MTTLKARLSDGDPGAEAGLSTADAQEMRRVIVSAAATPAAAPPWWGHSLAVAALIALMVGAGLFAGRRAADRDPLIVPLALEDPAPAAGGERRQLQFSTPGGTRIIWVFDPAFQLKETLP
jgi:hypothetical protein